MSKKNDLKAYIESYGTYLPPRILSSEDVAKEVRIEKLKLEQATGISNRRISRNMNSFDIAYEACRKALERSNYSPNEIDVIFCTSISKVDFRGHTAKHEPSEAHSLKKTLGLINAIAFDINNACAGMFTAIYIAEKMIKQGLIKRALICSGENISHLARTAQRNIDSKNHPELASLTLGDAGAAFNPRCYN